MKDIQTYNRIAPEGLELLDKTEYVLNESQDPDAIVLRSKDLHDITFNDSLVAIARAGAGVNNIPLERCSEHGIVVFNTPGANANAVKELVLAALVMSARPIYQGLRWVEHMEGDNLPEIVEANKNQFAGTELAGKRLAVIGLGAIGSLVANDAYNLGMDVIGYDPYVSVETAWNITSRVKKANTLQEVLRDADYITVHVPVNDHTKGLVNSDFLNQMKPGATLLNFARDGIIVRDDILEALNDGSLNKYVADFADEAFVRHPKALIFPHLGASTEEAEVNCAIMAVKTLKYFLETGNILRSVNFPTIDIPQQSPVRITLVNRNVPNMVGQISAILAKHFVNIDNIMNRSRGDFAYTIIDTPGMDEKLLKEIVTEMDNIDGVLRTRIIYRRDI
ncbi:MULTISPECIES: phosphoglycerate dehydrogenase [unclassified Jeotgalibaca]|uniref:phosphoglycerate dehydrogenase n=1 Tax=unclassified Jeotgalibaca TaxID=2621505 RepID=UPI003FD47814